jgi:hypothetical protein
LPQDLKKPKEKHLQDPANFKIDTPRDLLHNDPLYVIASNQPYRIVQNDFSLTVKLDPVVIMSHISEEARAITTLAIETAVDITAIIRGRDGKDEKTIVRLLGDKLNPDYYKQLTVLNDDDDKYLKNIPDDKSVDSVNDIHNDLENKNNVNDGNAEVDKKLQEALFHLGVGSVNNTSITDDETYKKSIVANNNQSSFKNNNNEDNNNDETSVALVTNFSLTPVHSELINEVVDTQERQRCLAIGLGAHHRDNEQPSSDEEEALVLHINDPRKLAEEKFKESNEKDLMLREEQLSIKFENIIEDKNCKAFMSFFKNIINANTAFEKDKIKLQLLSNLLKPLNLIDIMVRLNTSWEKLDIIIKETKFREEDRLAYEKRLKTEEGLKRQQSILDHAEDIEEMTEFFRTQCGLSRLIAKRTATEVLLKNISTPKKLAKIWQRNQVKLIEDFGLDRYDAEEVENALRNLLNGFSFFL